MADHDDKDEENRLFLDAVKDVRPLKPSRLYHQAPNPKPIPKQFLRDERQALADSLSDGYIPAHELESGEELLYLRDGHSPDILSKLRRGHWVVQAAIDLHGMVSDEARLYVAEFLAHCKKRGIRCVRIIHGKGTGALRAGLTAYLSAHRAVKRLELASLHEGGAGATVIYL